jgi:predicted AAA+ superfamily ATPase
MRRNLMAELIKWKNKDGRKPLIIEGVHQVGKSCGGIII